MNISLQHISGLPIQLSKKGIIFSPALKHEKVEIRRYKGYEKFFITQSHTATRIDKSKPLYYIYRNVRFPAHSPLFKKQRIRYDITLIEQGKIGNEAVRTVGHIHKKLPRTGRPSELYQVLSGKGYFYLQHHSKKEVHIIEAATGSWVYIHGSYAHSTINASTSKQLVIANIFTDTKNASDYRFFKKTHGPAFYPVWTGTKITFQKNPLLKGFRIKKTKTSATGVTLYPF